MTGSFLWIAAGAATAAILFLIFCAFLAKTADKHADDQTEHLGDIYIDDEGDMHASFDIPIETIKNTKYILMKVHHVKTKKG